MHYNCHHVIIISDDSSKLYFMTLTLPLAIALYLSAALLEIHQRGVEQLTPFRRWLPKLLLLVAICAHAAVLGGYLFSAETTLNVHILHLFALLALLVALFSLGFSVIRPSAMLDLSIYPVAVLSLLLLLIPHGGIFISNYDQRIGLHIISSLLAYALLSICAVLAIQIALQDMFIRRGRIIWPFQHLSIISQEQLLFRLMLVGVLLLSVSLLTGLLFVDNLFAQHLAHKTILSIMAWLVFAGLLLGRWRFGWRGSLAIRLTLVGMLLLLLAYFGSKFVLEVLMQESWIS